MTSRDEMVDVNIGYAFAQLERALRAASEPPVSRGRADDRVERWRDVISGMLSGKLTIGSRTPVADVPAWVTPVVAHGGFATGRLLAERRLSPWERERLEALPPDALGETERERLNLYFLSDAGLAEVLGALAEHRFHVFVPEEAAIPALALLLHGGCDEAARELYREISPWFSRFRFYPTLGKYRAPAGEKVHLRSAHRVAADLDAVEPNPRVSTMNRSLTVWLPLYDRLVELCAQTCVDGVAGATAPAGWADEADAWCIDVEQAAISSPMPTRLKRRHSPFARLASALESAPEDRLARLKEVSGALDIALAKRRDPAFRKIREDQARQAARPLHWDVAVARVVAKRLRAFPIDAGIPDVASVTAPAKQGESSVVPAGTAVPPPIAAKVRPALDGSLAELVAEGIVRSGESLAAVLPQLAANLAATPYTDERARNLVRAHYVAFRNRRSLLLLFYASQVRASELPWVKAFDHLGQDRNSSSEAVREVVADVTRVYLRGFPQTRVPNPLVVELRAIASLGGFAPPLVSELAADIFMGSFTDTWRDAAVSATRLLQGRLYAAYFDLPEVVGVTREFNERCARRSSEAGLKGRWTARNMAIIEQSQILTTHNLAVLTREFALEEWVEEFAVDLSRDAFEWIVGALRRPPTTRHPQLRQLKKIATAFRQMVFFMSFLPSAEALRLAATLDREVAEAADVNVRRFRPATLGLVRVASGERFDVTGAIRGKQTGRRLLGVAVGEHWLLTDTSMR